MLAYCKPKSLTSPLIYDTTHWALKFMVMVTSFPSDTFQRHLDVLLMSGKGVCRTLAVSRMDFFVTLVNAFLILTEVIIIIIIIIIITWRLSLYHSNCWWYLVLFYLYVRPLFEIKIEECLDTTNPTFFFFLPPTSCFLFLFFNG